MGDKESNFQSYEVGSGMTIEEIAAMFFDKNALREQPQKIFRLEGSSDRYYYTFDESGEVKFYISVSSLIQKTTPTSPHLIKWIAEMGYEESRVYTQDRADYGSFMHGEIARLLIDRKLDLDQMKERLMYYVDENELSHGFINANIDELKKDLLAFAQFVIDCKVRPYAIEIALAHKDGYAGMIDLPCAMTIKEKGFFGEVYKSGEKKGKPKETFREREITAIVDFKSGRKGFYEDHEIQLHAYRKMWNENFPELKVERIFNWSPKDWRGKTPTYNLKDQTDSKNIEKFEHLVQIAKIEMDKKEKSVKVISGTIDLDNPDIPSQIQNIDLKDLVKKNKDQKDAPND